MISFKKTGNKYFIKLEKGDIVMDSLTEFCKNQGIKFGTISAIGGVDMVTLGWYDLSSKSYHWKDFSGNLEIVSLMGNIALLDSLPFLHIHAVISDEDYHTYGGHLKESKVAVTLEVIIEISDGQVQRQMDDEIGLNLLNLEG